MKKHKTLILDSNTIRRLIGIKDAMKAIEKVFRYFGQGKTEMPPKIYIHLDKYKGDFRAMPAYVEGLKSSILKWVNVHPENKKKGLPTVMAIIILSDPRNGYPLCIMDGTYATALRTGAAGGIAAKYLARRDSRTLALLGCGAQAKTQLAALCEVFAIDKVNTWDIKRSQSLSFLKGIRALGLKTRISNSVRDCVKDCDIVVTTTPSRSPLVKLEWLKKGVHINAIGADAKGKRELDVRILKRAKIVVDSWEQASYSGEINVPLARGELSKKDIYADIGEIVTGKKKGRTSADEITLFDSTGLAVQDVAIADVIYRKAVEARAGKYVKFI
ncbi:MAG: alanine dehydrogenase [Candidatus Omnitrophica bacterium]|nr:alanine dehydrogenase [Candidatus Omnitrophota bacterium]